jgi:hypothetical protein
MLLANVKWTMTNILETTELLRSELARLVRENDIAGIRRVIDEWIAWEKAHIPTCERCQSSELCKDGKTCAKELSAAYAAYLVESEKKTIRI